MISTRFKYSRRASLIILLALSSLSPLVHGCGYHIAGTGSGLPPGYQTITIPTFRNETFEPVLESVITSFVKGEFLTTGRLRLTNSSQADLLLEGTLIDFERIPISFNQSTSTVIEYRIRMTVEIILHDLKTDKVVWDDQPLITTAEYFVNPDTSATRVAQDRAVAEASKHLAETLVARVLEGSIP